MSSENNKPIIQKAQEILQEYGHSVKTGHLYEVFSKLANEASWNVASNKKVSFLDKVINQFTSENDTSLQGQAKRMYEESLKEHPKEQGVTLGMLLPKDDKPAQLLNKRMELEPNALFVGAMGSGKSVGMSGTLFNYIQKNPEQTLLFIVDLLKGASEYQALFNLPKVFPVLNSELGLQRILTIIYDEALARKDAFNSVQAENISQYEEKTGKKLDRIILAIEEFHSFSYQVLNFAEEFKTSGTAAHRFHQLMRIGRSLGIWVFAATQKATKSDIPPEIIPNFTQKQIFRVSKSEASYLLGDTKAADIRSDQKGLCETDYGTVQFPMFTIDEQKKVTKNLKQGGFNNLLLSESFIKDTLSGDPEKIYSLRKLSDYVKEIKYYDLQLVLKRLHEEMGHKVQLVNHELDSYGIGLIIEWPSKRKSAVMFKDKISGKHINKLSKGMEINDCERGILYSLDKDLPVSLYKWAAESNIEIVDYEDLLRLTIQTEEKSRK